MKHRILASLALLPTFATAATATLDNPVKRIVEPGDLLDIIVAIVQFIGVPVVVIGLIYAGFKFVTAQGNEQEIAGAKRALLWVAIGAAVILGASVLKDVVVNTTGQFAI